MPSSPSFPCKALKIASTFNLLIKFKFFLLGSKDETLYLSFLRASMQALPLSKLTARSPDEPPKTTKIFLNFF